jgi:hypothetical protein
VGEPFEAARRCKRVGELVAGGEVGASPGNRHGLLRTFAKGQGGADLHVEHGRGRERARVPRRLARRVEPLETTTIEQIDRPQLV